MLTRYIIAFVLWVAWIMPFIRKAGAPRQKAAVKDPSARWGMIIQGVAFGIVYSIRDSDVPMWRVMIAIFLGSIAILTAHLAVRHLDKQWRFDAALNEDHNLVRSGPYSIVRHPIYAGMMAMLLSAGCLLAPWWAIIAALVIFVVGTEIRVRAEDRLLRSRFGEEFEKYARRVPAYVPFIR